MFTIQLVVQYVIPTVALVGLGGYLEHRFGSKVSSRVASVEARVAAIETNVKNVGADLKKAV